jgi:hypothetical protein
MTSGQDGSRRYTNLDGTKRAPYDVDFSNPLSHQTIGWLQPIAAVLTGGNEKLKNDLTGYLVNAALSNADTLSDAAANARAFVQMLGADPQQIAASISEMAGRGLLKNEQALAYLGGLASLAAGVDSEGAAVSAA